MKQKFRHLLSTLALLLCTLGMSAYAQSNPIGGIQSSLRSGDVGGIVRYIDNPVDITINNGQSTYSRAQAEMVLRDFFSKNQPRDFSVQQNGNANNVVFCIGYLNTSSGRYRVYVSLRQQDGGYHMQELRLEK